MEPATSPPNFEAPTTTAPPSECLTIAKFQSPNSVAPPKSDLQRNREEGNPLLPKEIRLMIWKLLLPPPRTIKLSERNNLDQKWPKGKNLRNFYTLWIESTYSIPKLMAISQESRRFALKYYSLILHDTLIGQPIFFDFSVDTLFLETISVLFCEGGTPGWAFSKNSRDSLGELQDRLKYLAVGYMFRGWGVPIENLIKGIKDLERLTIENLFQVGNDWFQSWQRDEADPEKKDKKKIFTKDGGLLELATEEELERRVKETEVGYEEMQ